MTLRLGGRRLAGLAGLAGVSVPEFLGELFWTALFWLLVFVVLGLLIWQVFPTPSR